jgi:hypothetical protein
VVGDIAFLAAATGIKSADNVPHAAHNLKTLDKTLAAHAELIKLLLDKGLLEKARVVDFMSTANARVYHSLFVCDSRAVGGLAYCGVARMERPGRTVGARWVSRTTKVPFTRTWRMPVVGRVGAE